MMTIRIMINIVLAVATVHARVLKDFGLMFATTQVSAALIRLAGEAVLRK
jgi:hypothetical protein